MSFVAVAVGAASIGGALIASKSASKGAKAQTQAADQSTALQREQNVEAARQYDQNRQDLAPARNIGTGSLYTLANLLGVKPASDARSAPPNGSLGDRFGQSGGFGQFGGFGQGQAIPSPYFRDGQPDQFSGDYYTQAFRGDTSSQQPINGYQASAPQGDNGGYQTDPSETGALSRNFTLADFNKDPGYEFRRSEGQRGLEASASARGGILSGGALKAIARYNQDAASQEYGAAYGRFNNDQTTRFNRLASLAGIGQTATGAGIAAGNAYTGQLQEGVNNITGNLNAAANARASQYRAQGDAITGAVNNISSYFALKDLYKTPKPPGGGIYRPGI